MQHTLLALFNLWHPQPWLNDTGTLRLEPSNHPDRTLLTPRHREQDKAATIYIGNIDERVSKEVMYEIAVQMGPILNLYMPLDRISQNHQGYGFVEYRTTVDADYAAQVLNGIRLYNKHLRINKATSDKHRVAEVGAELFVGNLDAMVDERVLYDTFSRFGPLLAPPKVAREDSGESKGYGFISYADFESSDAALANMNGQYLLSKVVSVDYAFKRDGKGVRHGDQAERLLAAQAKKRNLLPDAQPLPPAFLAGPPSRSPAVPTGRSSPPCSITISCWLIRPNTLSLSGVQAGSPALHSMPSMSPNMPPGFGPHQGPPPQHPPHYAVAGGIPQLSMQGGLSSGPPLGSTPSGLPARPPPAPAGYVNPADYHPGPFRPPPGGPNQPAGFPAVPPPGYPVPPTPPGGAAVTPPPGFMPPHGFNPAQGFPAPR